MMVHDLLEKYNVPLLAVLRTEGWPFEALVDQSWHEAGEGKTHNNYKLDAWQAGSLAKECLFCEIYD